jgi:hypothetical protein
VRPAPEARRNSVSRSNLRRRIAAAVVVVFATVALFGFSSVGASATPTSGTISGHVTDAGTDAPMPSVPVYLGGMGTLSASYNTTTDVNGYYEFDNLPFGYYQISLQGDYSYPDVHQTPAYITVDLTSTASTSVDDVAFPDWPTGTASVSGTVSMSDTGAPVPGVQVQLIAFRDDLAVPQTYYSQQVTTDSLGHYEIDNLPAYSYVLEMQFDQTLGSYDFNGPLVDVTSEGETVTRDQQIVPWPAPTSSVFGTVVDSVTGDPVSGASVDLSSWDNGSNYSGSTGADGTFDFTGVVPGSFSIAVNQSGYVDYQAPLGVYEYQADDLGSIGLHAADATISGTVDDSDSNPIGGANVYAVLTTDDTVSSFATTNPDGTYSLTGLEAGTYSVQASTMTTIQQFQTSNVSSGATSTTNFVLPALTAGGSISGTVRDVHGNPLAGICETAYDAAGDVVGVPSYLGTDPDGAYTVSGLSAGEYTILFSDCGDVLTHASTYLGGVYSLADSHMVSLGTGQNSTGTSNDVVLSAGGTIGGHVDVSAPGGYVPFPDGSLIVPVVQQHVDGTWVDWVNQTALAGIGAGDYQVNGLPPGQFRLEFEDTNEGVRTYETQWWSSTTPAGIATPDASSIITLAAGQVYTDKDAHMQVPVPAAAPTAVPGDPTTNDDNITATDEAAQGADITVNVGTALAGDWVSVWGHSSPQLMGTWAQVSSTGSVTVAVPTSLPVGSHHLVAQTSDGTLLGSVPLTVTAAPPSPPMAPTTPAGSSTTGSTRSSEVADAVTPEAAVTPAPTVTPNPLTAPTKQKPSVALPATPQGAPSQPPFPIWLLILIIGLVIVVLLIVFGGVRMARARR